MENKNKPFPSKPEQKPTIPDAQQSEAMVHKKGNKLIGRLPLSASVVFVLIASFIILILVFIENRTSFFEGPLTKEPSTTPGSEVSTPPAGEPGPAEPEEPILPIEQQLAESGVGQLLKDIYVGKIKPNLSTKEISWFAKYYDFNIGKEKDEWIELRIIMYPYVPGKKILRRYETLPTWERSFDKEVELFLNLKPGKQITPIFDDGPSRAAEVDFRKIGDHYFAVYETGFSAAGSFTRHYFTYDKANQQLIYVYAIFDFYAVQRSLAETADGQAYYKDVVYPENLQRFLDELEKLL